MNIKNPISLSIKDFFDKEPKQMILYGGREFNDAMTKAFKESINYNHYIETDEPSKKEYFKHNEKYRQNLLSAPKSINDILKLKHDNINTVKETINQEMILLGIIEDTTERERLKKLQLAKSRRKDFYKTPKL